jgi:hypothetical protein
MKVNNRLRRLEQKVPGPGDSCPGCRDRRQIALVESQTLPDGSTVPIGDWPSPCPVCGRIAETVVEIVRPFVAGPMPEAQRAES